MSMDGQGTKRRREIADNFNRLTRAHERYRRQTDGRATAYSERKREFAFTNNHNTISCELSIRFMTVRWDQQFYVDSILRQPVNCLLNIYIGR